MFKVEILEALNKLSAEEWREIRAKLNELDNEAWSDNGEISEREKPIIEARLDEYDQKRIGAASVPNQIDEIEPLDDAASPYRKAALGIHGDASSPR